jgi:hypothetical protein
MSAPTLNPDINQDLKHPPLDTKNPEEHEQALQREWITLQNNFEHYETLATIVKLAAVVLTALSASPLLPWQAGIFCILTLWLQEGIFKTFQARLDDRIVRVEQALSSSPTVPVASNCFDAFQLFSEFQSSRPGTIGLLMQYIKNALRPTVAFPYPFLLIFILSYHLV